MIIGIYRIFNILTGDFYIGSSVNIIKRFSIHKSALFKGLHHNKHLQSAWNKYGDENFKFEVIENCLTKKLLKREQFYIDKWLPVYNKRLIAESNFGMKFSEDTKKTMSRIHSERQKDKIFRQQMSETIKNSEAHKAYVKTIKSRRQKNLDKRTSKDPFSSCTIKIY